MKKNEVFKVLRNTVELRDEDNAMIGSYAVSDEMMRQLYWMLAKPSLDVLKVPNEVGKL